MPDPEALCEAAAEWLQWADADARVAAQLELSESFTPIVAYHAQQAVEKALKAICLYVQAPFVKTHDLATLLALVAPSSPEFAARWRHVSALTEFNTAGRYPSPGQGITDTEADSARKLAAEFVAAARAWIAAQHDARDQS